jgi:hypothetical protein
MLRRIGIAVLGLLAVSACDIRQPSPLADMPAPTEARVRAAAQAAEQAADRWAVRDTIVSTEGLDSLLTLVAASGRWRVIDDEPLNFTRFSRASWVGLSGRTGLYGVSLLEG